MTYNRYNTSNSNPRLDPEEDEDEAYWNHSSFRTKPTVNESKTPSMPRTDSASISDPANRYQQLQTQMIETQQRSLASTTRSLQLMNQSENVGIETANELARQAEQLQRAEDGLDRINSELTTSKRLITGMKSWFGPVKNYFSSPTVPPASQSYSHGDTSQKSTFSSNGVTAGANNTNNNNLSHQSKPPTDFTIFREEQMAGWSSAMKENEKQCNQNLQSLSGGIDRLKMLATNMGAELDRQNEQIDRMSYKTEGNNIKIKKQNADLHTLLK